MSRPGSVPNTSSLSAPDLAAGVAKAADAPPAEQPTQSGPTTDVTSTTTPGTSRQRAQLPPLASLTAPPGVQQADRPGLQSLLNDATTSSPAGPGVIDKVPQTASATAGATDHARRPSQATQPLPPPREGAQSPQHQSSIQQAYYHQVNTALDSHNQQAPPRPRDSIRLASDSYETSSGQYAAPAGGATGYTPSQSYAPRLPPPAPSVTPGAPPQYASQPPPARYPHMQPHTSASNHPQSPAFDSTYRFPSGPETQQTRPRSPHYITSGAQHEVAPHSASPERQSGGRYGSVSSPGGYSYSESQGMSFQIDVQGASRVADEKRRRNAGASARFRARRKEREQQNSREIDDLKRKIRELEEDSDFYRRERDYFVAILYNDPERDRHFPRPPSPRRLRTRHGAEEAYSGFEEQGQRGGDDRSARRRLTIEHHSSIGDHASTGRQEPQRQQQEQYAPPSHYGPPPTTALQSQAQYTQQQQPQSAQHQYYYAAPQPNHPHQSPSYAAPPPFGPPQQNRPPPPLQPPPPPHHGTSAHQVQARPASRPGPWPPNQPGQRGA